MYEAERAQLDRRQKILDALTTQAVTPHQTQMVSGRAVPYGIGQGLTQLAQAYLTRKGTENIEEERRALAEKEQQGVQDSTRAIIDRMMGRPENAPEPVPSMEGPTQPVGPTRPAVAPDVPGAALQAATDPFLTANKPAQNVMQALLKAKMGGQDRSSYFSPKESVIFDDEGKPSIKTEVFDHRSGKYMPSSIERISPKDPRIRQLTKFSEETGKQRGKGMEERYSVNIDEGLNAADAMATTKKAIDLLGEIKTSGLRNVVLKAKQFFGVEGADEGQLSANLGKAILAQLRPTFGAQFTEREGAKLDAIEASFGKSAESNIRLLNQTMQIFDRAARRGMSSAKRIGDTFAYDEIKKSMGMEIKDVPEGGPQKGSKEEKTQIDMETVKKAQEYLNSMQNRPTMNVP